MTAVSAAHPDREMDDEKLAVVEVEPVKKLKRPVTLAEMRANPRLEGLDLLRMSRLSVMPVSAEHWKEILKMAS